VVNGDIRGNVCRMWESESSQSNISNGNEPSLMRRRLFFCRLPGAFEKNASMSNVKSPKGFPLTVRRGSVTVKIYHTPNRGCDGYTLSYCNPTRKRQAFSELAKAKTEAERIATQLAAGLPWPPLGITPCTRCVQHKWAVSQRHNRQFPSILKGFLRLEQMT
jgi:hypothetical protein